MPEIPQTQISNENIDSQLVQPVESGAGVDGEMMGEVLKPIEKNNKWLMIGGVVALVFILGGAVLSYQKYMSGQKTISEVSDEPRVNVQTDQITEVKNLPHKGQYANELFGFKVILPENTYGLVNADFSSETDLYFDIFDKNNVRIAEIKVHPVQNETSRKDIFTQNSVLSGQPGLISISSSQAEDSQNFTKYDVVYKERNYLVYFYGESLSLDQKQILSTFEFVDSSNTKAIITKPKNYQLFEKSIVTQDSCNNPIGLVTYKDANGTMGIYSRNMVSNKEAKLSIEEVDQMLSSASFESWQDMNTFVRPFRNYCGGHFTYAISEIKNIFYPQTESVRAFLTYEGQDEPADLAIRVYANIGDEYIELSKTGVEGFEDYNMDNSCFKTGFSEDAINCYKEDLQSNVQLLKSAENEAKALINLFSID